jgi:ApeA N-terminal domain 1
VLAQCRMVSKRIVGAQQSDLEEFITGFKTARNYYTHYNPKLEKKAAKGVALLLLSIQLQAIIEMSLLRELGFPLRAIDAILDRTRRYEEIDHFRSKAAQETEDEDAN